MILEQIIKGEQIQLVPFFEEDVSSQYLGWLSDKEINQFLEVRFIDYSEELAKEYVKSCNSSTNIYFLRILTDKNIFIGTCTIFFDNNHRTAELGLMIGERSFHGKGIGSQVVSLLTKFCCSKLNTRKVTAGVYASNLGSLKAFIKSGFSIESFLVSQAILDGKVEDVYRLSYFCLS